jgi:hypothetical protein
MNDKKIEITVDLLNAVLAYLGAKPYQETFQIIQAIQEQAIPQMPIPAAAQPETTQ